MEDRGKREHRWRPRKAERWNTGGWTILPQVLAYRYLGTRVRLRLTTGIAAPLVPADKKPATTRTRDAEECSRRLNWLANGWFIERFAGSSPRVPRHTPRRLCRASDANGPGTGSRIDTDLWQDSEILKEYWIPSWRILMWNHTQRCWVLLGKYCNSMPETILEQCEQKEKRYSPFFNFL